MLLKTLLLSLSITVLEAGAGVPLVPASSFPELDAAGTLTVVTDASGDDGVGGWARMGGDDTLYLVSEPWPPGIAAALRRGSSKRARRDDGPTLSMPAAEAFGARAVAAAVNRVNLAPRAVVAVTDCKPAGAVLGGATSPNAQMRSVARVGAGLTKLWLGVHVMRELNLDADRLSHPGLFDEVRRDAQRAWPHVVRLDIHPDEWQALQAAAAGGSGADQTAAQPATARLL